MSTTPPTYSLFVPRIHNSINDTVPNVKQTKHEKGCPNYILHCLIFYIDPHAFQIDEHDDNTLSISLIA